MRIAEIFQSINGEVTNSHQGSFCTFIRFQGCVAAQCRYCDTKDSQDPNKGEELSSAAILAMLRTFPLKTRYVTITGGEPLEQSEGLLNLLRLFHQKNFYVITLETNGLYPIIDVKPFVDSIVMDYKLHLFDKASMVENFKLLRSKDWVKIPIQSEVDFKQAAEVRRRLYKGEFIPDLPKLAFSAVHPVTPKQLYTWIMDSKLSDVFLNTQIHKLIKVV